jgi:hypothetical protein
MKIAYLILAHDNPIHFQKLVGALNSGSSYFFIHVDLKSRAQPFFSIKGSNIYFVQKRIPVYWGDFSMVDATLRLLRLAFEAEDKYDYFVLLSGTDYPIQPTSYINHFFEKNFGTEFMNIVQIPCKAFDKPLSRLTTYYPCLGGSKIAKIIQISIVKTGLYFAHRDYKKTFGELKPFGGSSWWALSHGACNYILKFVDTEKKIVKFFKNTINPDESFFQTIIGNSSYKKNIKRNLTYTDWSAGGSHPVRISEKNLSFFESSLYFRAEDLYGKGELLFARKFSDKSEKIVREIERINKTKTFPEPI